MSTLTFDTLKFVKTLEAAGVPELQAEAISTAVRESHEAADVATKGDIADLRHEIKESASALRQEMSNMKFELLKWIIGLAIAQATLVIGLTGVLLALLKFFPINP